MLLCFFCWFSLQLTLAVHAFSLSLSPQRHRATWCRLAESRRKVPHIGVVRLGARPPRATPRLAVATAATPLLPVLNAARQIGAWYMAHLERHPILTKMVTSGGTLHSPAVLTQSSYSCAWFVTATVVFTLGDLGAQAIQVRLPAPPNAMLFVATTFAYSGSATHTLTHIQNGAHAPIDKPRLAAAIGYGVLLSAPINHTIYNHLDALALNVLRLRRTPMIAFKGTKSAALQRSAQVSDNSSPSSPSSSSPRSAV